MKTNLKLQPTLKQTLHLSTSMKNHLEILNMSSEKIIDHIRQLADRNPFIEFNPNEDIHELLMNNISTAPVLKDELYFQLHTCNRKYDSSILSPDRYYKPKTKALKDRKYRRYRLNRY